MTSDQINTKYLEAICDRDKEAVNDQSYVKFMKDLEEAKAKVG